MPCNSRLLLVENYHFKGFKSSVGAECTSVNERLILISFHQRERRRNAPGCNGIKVLISLMKRMEHQSRFNVNFNRQNSCKIKQQRSKLQEMSFEKQLKLGTVNFKQRSFCYFSVNQKAKSCENLATTMREDK
jgi:hypothetical protein